MKYLLILSLLSLSACATTGHLEYKLKAKVGQPIDTVINKDGPPDGVFNKPSGDQVYTWRHEGAITTTGGHGSYQSYLNYCNISFTTNNINIITDWYYQGNACRSFTWTPWRDF